MNETFPQGLPGHPGQPPAQPQPDRDLLQPEDVGARVNRHERKSVRTHVLIGLGMLLLALLLGRGIYENYQLRQGNNRLADAVGKQSLQLTQIGTVQPVLGSGFVQPGTVLSGPDGKQYVCAPSTGTGGGTGTSGTGGTSGTAGAGGTSGTSGSTGSTGAAGSIGATGAQGLTGSTGATGTSGATINMDEAYNNFGITPAKAIVFIDSAQGQGELRFDLIGSNDFVVQDSGTTFANFQNNGDVTFTNNLGIGDAAANENISNAGFAVNGDDLFVAGDAGVAGRIYSNTGLTVGGSTAYNDGVIQKTSSSSGNNLVISTSGVGDVNIVSANNISIDPFSDNDLTVDGRLALSRSLNNQPSITMTNAGAAQAASVFVGSTNPSLLPGVVADQGSLYLRDNGGVGELWLKTAGGSSSWTKDATVADINMDQAYNNFGASPATVTVDGAQGQGALNYVVSGANTFVVRDPLSTMTASFDASGLTLSQQNALTPLTINKTVLFGEAARINQSTDAYALHVVDSNATSTGVLVEQTNIAELGTGLQVLTQTGGNAVQINQSGGGRGLFVNQDNTTTNNLGVEIDWDEGELRPGFSAPLYIRAANTNLTLAGDSAARRAGIITVETGSTTADAFNYIAFNEGNGSDALWRVDSAGGTHAQAAYATDGADLAEYFAASDANLKPGEVVSVDPGSEQHVRRAGVLSDAIVGVISSKPAFVGNEKLAVAGGAPAANVIIVGLIGQLPVKVSEENGAIAPGDYLSVSSVPGRAKKAVPGESTVGVALESSGGKDALTVLVRPSNGGLATAPGQTASIGAPKTPLQPSDDGSLKSGDVLERLVTKALEVQNDLVVSGQIKAGRLVVDGSATFKGAVELSGHVKVGQDTAGSVTVKAGETSVRVSFATAYDAAPTVQVTPRDFAPGYRVAAVAPDGFNVELKEPATTDITFDWLALAAMATSSDTPTPAHAEQLPAPDSSQPSAPVNEPQRSWLDRLFSFRLNG